ncbi:MAG: GLPGLI family protein [Ginsengibacter sp.]
MKYIFIILYLLFTNPNGAYTQLVVDDLKNDSTKLYVQYTDYRNYVNDSIFSSVLQTSLFLGQRSSIYYYQTSSSEEYLKGLEESVTEQKFKALVVADFQKKYDLEKILSVVYAKYYFSPDHLLLKSRDDGDVWLSDTAVYKWSLKNEFKMINNYKCQKASFTNSKLEEVIVWFTEEIPISSGPLYLSGLPGLILEYYNPISKRFLTATIISSEHIPVQKFRNWLSGPIVSKSDYAELHSKGLKNFQQLKRMMDFEKFEKQ